MPMLREPVNASTFRPQSRPRLFVIAKLDTGASVTLQLKRGEQQFFASLRMPNGE